MATMALQFRYACDAVSSFHVHPSLSSELPSDRTFGASNAFFLGKNCRVWQPASCSQLPGSTKSFFCSDNWKSRRGSHSRAREDWQIMSVATDTARTADSNGASDSPAALTYLEGNSWLWDIDGVKILIDPVLVGPLDFGIPALYTGFKNVYRNFKLDSLPDLDVLLITQGLDDHCHKNTLIPLSQKLPGLPVIAPPSAEPVLKTLGFRNVMYLNPGESRSITAQNGKEITVQVTSGPVLGPPWQPPENGYIVKGKASGVSVYYEPHCVPGGDIGNYGPVDVVVTPVVKQVLPASFVLVSGQEDAVKLITALKPKYLVLSSPGELEASGVLAVLAKEVGTVDSFKALLAAATGPEKDVEVLCPQPGLPLPIPPSV